MSHEESIEELRRLIGFAPAGTMDGVSDRKIVILASASCTLEEMFLMKKLSNATGGDVFVARHVPDGVEDSILRKADKHANVRGAEMLGMNVVDLQVDDTGADAPVRDVLGSDGALICVGFNTNVSSAIKSLAAKARTLIVVAGCESSLTDDAQLVIPGLTFAEKDGLVVNFAGHIQRLKPGMHRAGWSEWKILDATLASLKGVAPREFITPVRENIVAEERAFFGMDLSNVGVLGLKPSGQEVEA
jgi:NADH dehydrogenase/NADH:ubiquinone oxidoreductase subunit G